MSEFWVSRKRWTCKYCDVTINDDVPSRQQHENGLRHKGNVERHLRQAYKKSERDRKDERDAKREMAKIEKLAQQSHAKDLASGSGGGSSATGAAIPGESTSLTPEPPKPPSKKGERKEAGAWKPTNKLAAYGSALPFTSPEDEENALREWQEKQEERRKIGEAGDWQTVEPSAPTASHTSHTQSSNTYDSRPPAASYVVREKQGHFRNDDDEDDLPNINVKKRVKVQSEAERLRQAEEDKRKEIPSWRPMRLDTGISAKEEGVQAVPIEKREPQKEEIDLFTSTEAAESKEVIQNTTESASELDAASTTASAPSMFKKRKAGAGAGAKRVRAVI